MSWIDQIENFKLTITCGDGVAYNPNWINAKRLQEYNISEFDFPGIAGTLVKRNKPLGIKHSLEIYFQGEDHLDTAEAFRKSSDDPAPWKLDHPFYGRLIVQPTSLEFDNSVYNITKISGAIIETITEDNPITSVSPVDAIPIAKNTLDTSFENIVISPAPTDINTLSQNNQRNFKLGVPIITIPTEFEDYNHAFNIMNAAVNNAIADASLAMTLTMAFITKPAIFSAGLQTRINTLSAQFKNLRQGISALINPNSKYIYEVVAGTTISAMALATTVLTDADSLLSGDSLFSILNQISTSYNQYLQDLDDLQTLNGGNTTSFIADGIAITNLNDLVNLAISSLFQSALNSKQQRSITTDSDTNIILLTHQLYGLDDQDDNIQELMAENNIGLTEILQIKKGRKIVYYI